MPRIPISISTGTIKEANLIVGIDLGTTNSLIAKMQDGEPVAIADFDKEVIVPSVVHFGQGGQATVGDEAKEKLQSDPRNTIYSVKRLMGKNYQDIGAHLDYFSYNIIDDEAQEDKLVKVEIHGRYYTPIELSSFILKELKARAEHKLKAPVEKAVITVPAYFNDSQRQATRDAGKLAGLDVLRIVNEPTAAALAYGMGLGQDDDRTVAVYDLGGGTFDVTILRIEGGVFEVLATHGDTYLGGDDFDRVIQEHWLEQLGIDAKVLQDDKAFGQQLRLRAEEAKKALSKAEGFKGNLQLGGKTYAVALSREDFEQMVASLIERTLASCRAALADAELDASQIDDVILVGGSTRVPAVKEAVGQLFQRTPHDKLNPDEVVALGAAIQADILAGNRKDLLLLDVTPLSLGIETAGGLMDTLIPRNSKIPTKVGRQYTTQVDGQTGIQVAVYQGERDIVADNRKLAEFELSGIPAMPAGLPKVEITFLIDADGILQVSAKELRSGVEQSTLVKPSYGLTDEQVESMLLDSLTNAQADVDKRMLLEAQEEARQRVYHAENFVAKHSAHLSDEEAKGMLERVQQLKAALESGTKDALHKLMDELDAYSKPFAQRVMDEAIGSALSGKTLDEAENV